MAKFIQLALYANMQTNTAEGAGRTVFLLGDEVVLCFDAGLEGVEVLPLVLLHVCRRSLQDVVGRGGTAARAALRAAGLRYHVGVFVPGLVFLDSLRGFDREGTGETHRVACLDVVGPQQTMSGSVWTPRRYIQTWTMAIRCCRRCSMSASSSISSPSKSSKLQPDIRCHNRARNTKTCPREAGLSYSHFFLRRLLVHLHSLGEAALELVFVAAVSSPPAPVAGHGAPVLSQPPISVSFH